jgi:hypothetical protein
MLGVDSWIYIIVPGRNWRWERWLHAGDSQQSYERYSFVGDAVVALNIKEKTFKYPLLYRP